MRPDAFAQQVLRWYDDHGRKDLPWQHEPTPYRVWVSEIMLQQTQVSTVLGYFDRFMTRFPTVQALAAAPVDDVLQLWTGLGYYARARNLQKAAQQVVRDFNGDFPADVDTLATLPGIGRSTAGAIVALAHEQQATILDGNVKRVLARFHAVAGNPADSNVLNQLWQHAQTHTPTRRIRAYTQAMMDLGATLCTRSKPRCGDCPLAKSCLARAAGNPQDYPGRKPAKKIPVRRTLMLIVRNAQGEVLLEQRPPAGLWGGLWGFIECADEQALADALAARALKMHAEAVLPAFRHTFSHFHLDIEPRLVQVVPARGRLREQPGTLWQQPAAPVAVGVAAPVVKLLASLAAGQMP